MRTALSLRIARLLLFAAGAFALGLVAYIAALSQDRGAAWPWLALLGLNAAGFFAAWTLLPRDPRRAKLVAVGSAIAMAALATITGWGAGTISFPAAGVGALGAWAALLHPPRRPMVIAFVAYTAIGVAIAGPGALLFPVFLPTIFIWPVRLGLFGASSILAIYLFIAVGGVIALVAVTPRRTPTRRLGRAAWVALGVVAIAAGAAAVFLFAAIAFVRADTSARFELDALVLGMVYAGGALAAFGALTLALVPRSAGAVLLGLGGALLFMTFSARPAVTCYAGGNSNGVPLAWSIRTALTPGASTSAGSSGSISGGPSGSISGGVSTGRFRYGDRTLAFRCEGPRLVEYREVAAP